VLLISIGPLCVRSYQGAKRVGFALLISTVNDAGNGGSAYKEIWDESNHFENKITATGYIDILLRLTKAFAGFIDPYGFSI